MTRFIYVIYNIMGKQIDVTSSNLRVGGISDSIRLKKYTNPNKSEILKIKLYTWGEVKLSKNINECTFKISYPIMLRRIVLNSFIRC